MTRDSLSKTYLKGRGIEIGALHNPWPTPPGAECLNVDRYDRQELIRQYPELDREKIAETQIVDNGFMLNKVDWKSCDFILASHVLEHSQDPYGAIHRWMQKLRNDNSVLLLAVPEMTQTFDRRRTATTLEHLIADYTSDTFREWYRPRHHREFHSLAWGGKRGADLELAIDNDIKTDAHIHFHCWTAQTLLEFFTVGAELFKEWTVEAFSQEGAECLAVLKPTW